MSITAKEKAEIISYKLGKILQQISQTTLDLNIHLHNYQMMTVTAFVYAHLINTQLKNDKKEFKRNVNNRVQNKMIKAFKNQGVMPQEMDIQGYKTTLSSCLNEWDDRNKNKEEPEEDTSDMIIEYFQSEGIDFSKDDKVLIQVDIRYTSLMNDEDALLKLQQASSGCIIPIIISLSSLIGILLIILIGI